MTHILSLFGFSEKYLRSNNSTRQKG